MVSVLDALRSMFSDAGFTSGAEFYGRADAAAAYLDACAQHGLVVLGVEAFELRGDKLKPRLGLIADFSGLLEPIGDWNDTTAASHRAVARVLRAEHSRLIRGLSESRYAQTRARLDQLGAKAEA